MISKTNGDKTGCFLINDILEEDDFVITELNEKGIG